jgi:hypothetical protein
VGDWTRDNANQERYITIMKRPFAVLWRVASALVVVLLIVLAWPALRDRREPLYKNKTVQYWFLEYSQTFQYGPAARKQAADAWRAFGTNALPYLTRVVFAPPDSQASVAFNRIGSRIFNESEKPGSEQMRECAVDAIRQIQPPASALLPQIERCCPGTNLATNRFGIVLLGTVGDGWERAIPYLTNVLLNPDPTMRDVGLQSLGWLGPRAASTVPAVIDFLKRETGNVRHQPLRMAAEALEAIGTNASAGAPLVETMFEEESNPTVKCALAGALYGLDPANSNAISYLESALEARPSDLYAIGLIGRLGPKGKRFIPLLFAMAFDKQNDTYGSMALSVLQTMGVPEKELAAEIKKNLGPNANPSEKFNSALQVLWFDPTDHDGIITMMQYLRDGGGLCAIAVDTLGRAGASASEAIPKLRDIQKNGTPQERKAARDALRRIESGTPR